MSGNRARGGRAEFSWEKVKEQSFSERSHYLGASLHARNERGAGNPQWYLDSAKDGSAGGRADALRKEVDEVKKREEELMRAALGLPPLQDDGIDGIDTNDGGRGRDDRALSKEERDARRRRKKEKREKKEKRGKKERRERRERSEKKKRGERTEEGERQDRKDEARRRDRGAHHSIPVRKK